MFLLIKQILPFRSKHFRVYVHVARLLYIIDLTS